MYQELRRHIDNTYDVRKNGAESCHEYDRGLTLAEKRHAWQEWKGFVLSHIGPPAATENHTESELSGMGMVGIWESPKRKLQFPSS